MGANSLVFCVKGKGPKGRPIDAVIKVSLQGTWINTDQITTLNQIISRNNIGPFIYSEQTHEYGSDEYLLSIVMSARIIPFEQFRWTSVSQKKRAVVSLMEKVFKLHQCGFVHNDLKYENFGMTPNGEVYIFDFDNFDKVTATKCSVDLSSSLCHPPTELRTDYIKAKLGNRIVDLFPAIACTIGDIIGVKFWQFTNEQLAEKSNCLAKFNRGKTYFWIQHNLSKKIRGYTFTKEPFWYAFTNLVHLILKEVSIRTRKSFYRRANVLIKRMRAHL
jgi:serine/threonine protein kinase